MTTGTTTGMTSGYIAAPPIRISAPLTTTGATTYSAAPKTQVSQYKAQVPMMTTPVKKAKQYGTGAIMSSMGKAAGAPTRTTSLAMATPTRPMAGPMKKVSAMVPTSPKARSGPTFDMTQAPILMTPVKKAAATTQKRTTSPTSSMSKQAMMMTPVRKSAGAASQKVARPMSPQKVTSPMASPLLTHKVRSPMSSQMVTSPMSSPLPLAAAKTGGYPMPMQTLSPPAMSAACTAPGLVRAPYAKMISSPTFTKSGAIQRMGSPSLAEGQVMRLVCYKCQEGKEVEWSQAFAEIETDIGTVGQLGLVAGLVDFIGSFVNPRTYAACFIFNSQAALDQYQAGIKGKFLEKIKPLMAGNAVYDQTGVVNLRYTPGSSAPSWDQVLRIVCYKCQSGKEDAWKALMEKIGARIRDGAVRGCVEMTISTIDTCIFMISMVMESQAMLDQYKETVREEFLEQMKPLMAGGPIFDDAGPIRYKYARGALPQITAQHQNEEQAYDRVFARVREIYIPSN